MASIGTDPGGRRRILFVGPDNRRRTIRLGKIDQRTAEAVCRHVEGLLSSKMAGQPVPRETASWLASLGDVLYGRLARVGLVEPRKPADDTRLGPFVEQYIAGRTDVSVRTIINLRQAAKGLLAYFGPDKPLRAITPGDADEFRRWLAQRLGPNTVRRHCGRCKQFFRAAVRKRLIPESPFQDMPDTAVRPNPEKFHFVGVEESERILAACPDHEWRLIFALCRYGGLRCPSEVLALEWSDINWAEKTMIVRASKTRHHHNATRVVPIFSELQPILAEAFERAEPGARWVITRYRDTNANLRTQLLRIIRKAGMVPWEKPFQNLRSTRETELLERYPIQCVVAWLGNSEPVARGHYLQVRREYIEAATTQPTVTLRAGGTKSGTVASGNQRYQAEAAKRGVFVSACNAPRYDNMPLSTNTLVPPEGLEPSTL